ncbi:hypothetical protein L1887_20519 [Cichorium endivia]|nr:hypothetical protein L1887_20519 [Cichorium endivia]
MISLLSMVARSSRLGKIFGIYGGVIWLPNANHQVTIGPFYREDYHCWAYAVGPKMYIVKDHGWELASIELEYL